MRQPTDCLPGPSQNCLKASRRASRKRPKVVAFLLIGRVAQITRGEISPSGVSNRPFHWLLQWMKGLRNELSKESAGGQRPLLAPKLVHMTPAEREDAARLLAALIQQKSRHSRCGSAGGAPRSALPCRNLAAGSPRHLAINLEQLRYCKECEQIAVSSTQGELRSFEQCPFCYGGLMNLGKAVSEGLAMADERGFWTVCHPPMPDWVAPAGLPSRG